MSGNVTSSSGGSTGGYGGGIYFSQRQRRVDHRQLHHLRQYRGWQQSQQEPGAEKGAGIFSDQGGTVNVTNSTISGNAALVGGGSVYRGTR